MKILILGSGGREHALAKIYSKSKRVEKVFVVPGNGLMDFQSDKIKIFPEIKSTDFEGVLDLAKEHGIDLVDVAQDDPLALGFVDQLKKNGITAFGPMQKAAEIEWNKEWARNFMQKYNLPIPSFKVFKERKTAIKYIGSLPEQTLYIKASGLAAGKGAIKTKNKRQAIKAISKMSQFGKAGETFLIEECLVGEEFSLFAICDGKNYKITKIAQDHKTVYNSDQGPNTGGLGCVAPAKIIDRKILKEVETKILKPFLLGMQKEKRPYAGILYLGGIVTGGGVKIIEFNARWGDPEAEVILPGIQTDYLKIIDAVLEGKLNKLKIDFDNKVRVSVAGCSLGYPDDYSKVKGKEIFGLNLAMKLKSVKIFGAGIKRKGKKFFADGGRIFHLVAEGKDIREARKRAYEAMSLIFVEGNNLHYRIDIGWRDVERQNKNDNQN